MTSSGAIFRPPEGRNVLNMATNQIIYDDAPSSLYNRYEMYWMISYSDTGWKPLIAAIFGHHKAKICQIRQKREILFLSPRWMCSKDFEWKPYEISPREMLRTDRRSVYRAALRI